MSRRFIDLIGRDRQKPKGFASFNQTLLSCKKGARQRGLKWNLSRFVCLHLFQERCFYCGAEPVKHFTVKRTHGCFYSNGIDRIDSTKGYTRNNVVSCCTKCNFMKGSLSSEDFLAHLKQINRWLKNV
jgi:hypothetical protein